MLDICGEEGPESDRETHCICPSRANQGKQGDEDNEVILVDPQAAGKRKHKAVAVLGCVAKK